MASYNEEEIASMRNDAIMRVQEMHKRSQNFVNNSSQNTQNSVHQANNQMTENIQENTQEHLNNQEHNNNQPKIQNNNSNNNLNNMGMGNSNPINSLFSGLMGGGSNNQKKSLPLLSNILPNLGGGHNSEKGQKGGLLGGLFDGILGEGKIDSEKIILIGLIILLAREGCDLKLLIAIGYLLM